MRLNEKVDLEVYGRRLTVEIEGITPIELQALAQDLTERMAKISRESQIVDSSKLALVAALECLADVARLKAAQENQRFAEDKALEQAAALLRGALEAK